MLTAVDLGAEVKKAEVKLADIRGTFNAESKSQGDCLSLGHSSLKETHLSWPWPYPNN